jgi:hypothetical protein
MNSSVPVEIPGDAKLSVQCRKSRRTDRYRFTINARWKAMNAHGWLANDNRDFGIFVARGDAGSPEWNAAKDAAKAALLEARAELAARRVKTTPTGPLVQASLF